jgi:hypothetical protein
MLPAEAVAPDHPINVETAPKCSFPLQTIVRSADAGWRLDSHRAAPPEAAATLGLVYMTAGAAVIAAAGLREGETVLITGELLCRRDAAARCARRAMSP